MLHSVTFFMGFASSTLTGTLPLWSILLQHPLSAHPALLHYSSLRTNTSTVTSILLVPINTTTTLSASNLFITFASCSLILLSWILSSQSPILLCSVLSVLYSTLDHIPLYSVSIHDQPFTQCFEKQAVALLLSFSAM